MDDGARGTLIEFSDAFNVTHRQAFTATHDHDVTSITGNLDLGLG